MRLTATLLIVLGATVFAIGVAFMILTFSWIVSLDSDAAASGFAISLVDSSRMIAFALAGYLVAAGGSSLARNAARERKSLRTAADV